MFTDKIFQSIGHLRFAFHAMCNGLGASLSSIDLCHGASGMAKNAIVVSRSVGEECISCDFFVPSVHIGGRPSGTVVLAERIAICIPRKLCSGFDRFLDALDRQPTKVGTKGLKVSSSYGNGGALIDAMFQEIWHVFIDATHLSLFWMLPSMRIALPSATIRFFVIRIPDVRPFVFFC
jgi:hypothetical protein